MFNLSKRYHRDIVFATFSFDALTGNEDSDQPTLQTLTSTIVHPHNPDLAPFICAKAFANRFHSVQSCDDSITERYRSALIEALAFSTTPNVHINWHVHTNWRVNKIACSSGAIKITLINLDTKGHIELQASGYNLIKDKTWAYALKLQDVSNNKDLLLIFTNSCLQVQYSNTATKSTHGYLFDHSGRYGDPYWHIISESLSL